VDISSIIQYDLQLTERGTSLTKEMSDIWGWFLEFFKQVVVWENQDPNDPKAGARKYMKDNRGRFGFSFGNQWAWILCKEEEGEILIYEMLCPIPIPSDWFIMDQDKEEDFYLHFIIKVNRKTDKKEPIVSGGMHPKRIYIRLFMPLQPKERLSLQHISIAKSHVKSVITHELKHFLDMNSTSKTKQWHKSEADYADSNNIVGYDRHSEGKGFQVWLNYMGGPGEMSARVNQIARYARENKISPTQAFEYIIIRTIKNNINKNKEEFSPKVIPQIKQIIKNQIISFNKHYPKWQINLRDVMPDEAWFNMIK
jgi:hypothetical protein